MAEVGADGAKSGHYETSATEMFSGANNGAQRERSSLSCKLIEAIALSPEGILTAGSHACLRRFQTPTI